MLPLKYNLFWVEGDNLKGEETYVTCTRLQKIEFYMETKERGTNEMENELVK